MCTPLATAPQFSVIQSNSFSINNSSVQFSSWNRFTFEGRFAKPILSLQQTLTARNRITHFALPLAPLQVLVRIGAYPILVARLRFPRWAFV